MGQHVIWPATTNIDVLELFLFLRGDQIEFPDKEDNSSDASGIKKIMNIAAENEGDGAAVLQVLLDRYGDQISITGMEKIVKTADANTAEVMNVLLDRYGEQISMAELGETVKIAAGKRPGPLKVLLDRYGDQIDLTEEVAKAATLSGTWRVELSTVLIRAALDREGNYEEFIRLLLETNSRPTGFRNIFSWEMLLYAMHCGDNEICNLLLEIGRIDDDLKDIEQGRVWTPLFYAIRQRNQEVVKVLVDNGKVNIKNVEAEFNGREALSWAAEEGLVKTVEQLLRIEGIQIDSRDFDKRTPLHWAAKEGKDQVVKGLLDTGKVDVNAKDDAGETAFSQASRGKYQVILQLLGATGKLNANSEQF
ncbi:hypothetical protein INS49_000272 [Diaporthe citri]|uniref:uncharacterized protein n=1 Tax=Diaporthe citri TaxID=83186 RepID=UPI001C7E85A3|nr:uncharacterized protein INS49_000272 [Diaporthe citri]KAG6366096.1 hypothetical protein INS49_000272 [Diaporthe citri]